MVTDHHLQTEVQRQPDSPQSISAVNSTLWSEVETKRTLDNKAETLTSHRLVDSLAAELWLAKDAVVH